MPITQDRFKTLLEAAEAFDQHQSHLANIWMRLAFETAPTDPAEAFRTLGAYIQGSRPSRDHIHTLAKERAWLNASESKNNYERNRQRRKRAGLPPGTPQSEVLSALSTRPAPFGHPKHPSPNLPPLPPPNPPINPTIDYSQPSPDWDEEHQCPKSLIAELKARNALPKPRPSAAPHQPTAEELEQPFFDWIAEGEGAEGESHPCEPQSSN